MNLSHLVYTSTRKPSCTAEEIDNILQSCQKNNGKNDITGVLLYSDKHFIQYLEGDYQTVISLYDKIKEDDRHTGVRMITLGSIPERAFPSWQMGTKTFNNQDLDFLTDITAEDRTVFDSLLKGEELEGQRAMNLIKKFFE